MKKYVITYDNGSGYREWASVPQASESEAWEASGLPVGGQFFAGSDTRLEVFDEVLEPRYCYVCNSEMNAENGGHWCPSCGAVE